MSKHADVLCGQINLQKGAMGTQNLISYLSSALQTGCGHKPSGFEAADFHSFLIFLQEPPCKGKRLIYLDRSHQVFYAQSNVRPRSAIYASRDLNLWFSPQFSDGDITTCIWRRKGTADCFIASVYLDITADAIPDSLERLVNHCRDNNIDLMFGADTNAHSSLWNSADTNRRGESLEEFVLKHSLQIHNRGNHFTFHRGMARTIIDVTFSLGAIGNNITDWHVSDDVQGSDHLLLQWRLTISSPKSIQIRNYEKGDWPSFQVCLEESSTPKQFSSSTFNKLRLDLEAHSFLQDIFRSLAVCVYEEDV